MLSVQNTDCLLQNYKKTKLNNIIIICNKIVLKKKRVNELPDGLNTAILIMFLKV